MQLSKPTSMSGAEVAMTPHRRILAFTHHHLQVVLDASHIWVVGAIGDAVLIELLGLLERR